eukprot:scaffold128014_cov33-Cyclotella_meneghiniana.AAC.2
MLTSKDKRNRERRLSSQQSRTSNRLAEVPLFSGVIFLVEITNPSFCSTNAIYSPTTIDAQHPLIEARLSSLNLIQPLRTVGSPFRHDQCVGIGFLMPDGAASLSKSRRNLVIPTAAGSSTTQSST